MQAAPTLPLLPVPPERWMWPGHGIATYQDGAGTRYFLKQQAYDDPACITPETHEGLYRTCRRPGAYWAPICFLTGLLNCDIRAPFGRLRQPVLTVWGRQATTTRPFRAREFRAANPRVAVEVIDNAAMLTQDERPLQFNRLARAFLAG